MRTDPDRPVIHDRHHRQRLLPCVGDAGQERLRDASVAIVGVGALGCVSADLLARAGVGSILLIDLDIVEPTNLQRQTLFAESDVGDLKTRAAARRLRSIDASLNLIEAPVPLDADRARELLPGVSVLLDGTDNFDTRYLLNDASIAFDVPLIHGGAVGTIGSVLPVLPGRGPCLRCISESVPVQQGTCDTIGVLGPLVATVAARQAAIAIRLIVDGADRLPIVLESVDAWSGRWTVLEASGLRDRACPCCVERGFDWLDEVSGPTAVAMCGRDSVQIVLPGRSIDLDALAARLDSHGGFASDAGLLRGSFGHERGEAGGPISLVVFGDGRAIVSGTSDPVRARAIYAKYIGA